MNEFSHGVQLYPSISSMIIVFSLRTRLLLQVTVLMGTDWDRHYDLLKKPDYFVKVPVHQMLFRIVTN